MTLKQTTTWGRGTVFEGEINGYRVLALVTDYPSPVGLGYGRIEQLHVGRDGSFSMRDNVLQYVREWLGAPPTDRRLQDVVEQTVYQIEGKRVDWAAERQRYKDGISDVPIDLG